MKFSHISIAVFGLPSVLALAVRKAGEPELPDIEQIFKDTCLLSVGLSCPEAAEAAQPFIDGNQEFTIETIVEIAEKVKDNQGCVDSLPPCVGQVVEKSLAKLLGATEG